MVIITSAVYAAPITFVCLFQDSMSLCQRRSDRSN